MKINNIQLKELIRRYQSPDFDKQLTNFHYSNTFFQADWIRQLNAKYFRVNTDSISEILTEIGVLQDDMLTQAGLLCFPTSEIPLNAIVKLARFKGDTPDVFIDMKNTTGNIIQSVDESISFIFRSINMRVEIVKLIAN